MIKQKIKKRFAQVLIFMLVLSIICTSAFAAKTKNVYTVKIQNSVMTILKNSRRITPNYRIDPQGELILFVQKGKQMVGYTDSTGKFRKLSMGTVIVDEWSVQGKLSSVTLDHSLGDKKISIDAKSTIGVLNIDNDGTVILYGAVEQSDVGGSAKLSLKNKNALKTLRLVNSKRTVTIDLGIGNETLQILSANTDATLKNVTWTVINGTGSATISPNGVLTGQTNGTITITIANNRGTGSGHSIPAIGGTVAITGEAKFGAVLTAVPSLTNAGTPTYQWYRGGIAIPLATAATYTSGAADIGAVITVTATADGLAGTGSIISTPTGAVEKADGPAAPLAPTVASATSMTVSLTPHAQNEFSRDNGSTWQDSEVFGGLTGSTTYTFITRVKATATTKESAASAGTSVTTGIPPVMGGTLAITGDEKYGSTLTASPSLTDAGTPTYQWYRDGIEIPSATAGTYTLAEEDIGAVVTVTATADGLGGTGSITSAPTGAIEKEDGPAAPEAPQLDIRTYTSISLIANPLYEYKMNNGAWRGDPTFTGLLQSRPYQFVARVKETSTTKESAESVPTIIYTLVKVNQ